VPVKWLVLLAVAPITLLFGLLAGLFHQLVWQLRKFDSLTGSLLVSAIFDQCLLHRLQPFERVIVLAVSQP